MESKNLTDQGLKIRIRSMIKRSNVSLKEVIDVRSALDSKRINCKSEDEKSRWDKYHNMIKRMEATINLEFTDDEDESRRFIPSSDNTRYHEKEGSVEINATPVDVVTQSKEDECSNDYFHEVRSLEEHERAKSSSSDILWNEKTKDKDVSKQSDISVANELMKKTQLINNVIPRSINNKEEVLTCCDAQQNTVGNASYTNGNHVVKKSKLVARSKNIARIYKSQSLYELRDVILKLLLYFMMELVQVFSNARINPNQDVGKVDAISVKVTSLERCWDDRSNMKRTCEHTNKVLKWKDKIADAGHQTQLTTNTSAVDHRQTQEFTLDIYRQKFGSKRFVAGDLGRNLVETTSCRPGGCC
ncbi:hypothetical protein RDWZM_003752 [Blomia tropicalis]|uniref:Uncharacterized protein n=1 Tax=Blomia tropicalis TaxID=40697 RepID=A0A9Q0MIV6_BLOTA|nr:hypothetical protein RDWZM_003752 [Blomia tropicalis]